MAKAPNVSDKIGFYGRRQGRPLSALRQKMLEENLPPLEIKKDLLKENGTLDPSTLFSPFQKAIFEIGFGGGEHLAEMIRRMPENAYIGVEPFINGMSAFLKEIQPLPQDHIRLYMNDALEVVRSLKSESIDSFYILNPDPWHKARHHKRRIVRKDTLEEYYRVLKPGGDLILTTDVEDLAEWMATHVHLHGGFKWLARSAHDWQVPPKGWISTRYETKGAKGAKKMSYLFYKKNLQNDV